LLAELDQLRKINEELKYRLNQYNNKELNYNSQLAEINELKERMNKLSDEKAYEMKLNEESIQRKIDEKENFLKQKYLKKEEQLKEELISEVSGFQKDLEKSKQEIERYRKENLNLQEKVESLETLMANKEHNTKKLLEHKDQEYEKILHLYKQSQNEKNHIELHTNEKTTEYINNYNSMQDILKTLEKECEDKDKIINNLNDEIQNYKQSLGDIDLNFNEIKSQFERREKINEMLKNENMVLYRLNIGNRKGVQ
jgi:chromosome segregation ATPase